ncbi:hypothetical protein ACFC1R_26665 [Kitasatospora sp. NPDC056138]|uniref:hypothetical protein n=1 Tax=Kitasatospora sp. NPDC056138 TaxID=3345724 RepID=UPI0035DF9321
MATVQRLSPGAVRGTGEALWRTVLALPFRGGTWRQVTYLLLALPVGLGCVALALVGGPAGRVQRGLLHRLLGVRIEEPERAGRLLSLLHSVVSLPLNAVALAVTCYGWLLVPLNLGWPLRPLIGLGDGDYRLAWGGPTFAGAWAFHAVVGGVSFLLLMPWLGRGLTTLQARLATALLGPRRGGAAGPLVLALLVAAVGAVLSVAIVHQL